MTPVDELTVVLYGQASALYEPYRWPHKPCWAATHILRAGYAAAGMPYRASGDKNSERDLTLAVALGLVVRRRGRSKTVGARLTAAGVREAWRLLGIPADDALAVAHEVHRLAPEEGRWVAEIEFNGGRGWGDSHSAELKEIGALHLPALVVGWVESNCDPAGRVGYRVTPAGREAVAAAEAPGGVAEGPDAAAPEPEPGALDLYLSTRGEALRWLDSLKPGAVGDSPELGALPLPPGAFTGSYRGP